jgi:Protein of unknown function (DUF4240)
MNDTDERFLWSMIELAWKKAEKEVGEAPGPLRKAILGGDVTNYEEAMRPFCEALEALLRGTFRREALLSFAKAFETMLYRLDRADLAARVGLGDDGFLDARGFTVAMGETYFHRVLAQPASALVQASAEQTYLAIQRAYERRFQGAYPDFGIGVATGSNLPYWPKLQARAVAQSRLGRATDEAWVSLGLSEGPAPLAGLVFLQFLSRDEREDVILRLAARIRQRRARRGG